MNIPQVLELALQHHQSGQLPEAEQLYRQILLAEPKHANALHLLGVLAHQAGQYDVAADLIRQSIKLEPTVAAFHGNLGTALDANGKFDEAITAFRKAVRLSPNSADVHNNMGNSLRKVGRFDDAVAACRRALELQPDFAQAHNNLGIALKHLGRLGEATQAYLRAVELKPDYAEAYNNLAITLYDQGLLEQSMTACQRALQLNPDYAKAHNSLGNVLKSQGRLDEALGAYRRALAINPDLESAHSALIFAMDLSEGVDVAEMQAERRTWYERQGRKFAANIPPYRNNPDPDRKLRIGYVSADFRRHSACYVFAPILSQHDRANFEVYCYSGVKNEDDLTERLRKVATVWRSTLGLSDEALAAQIRRDKVDILVDLSGHSDGNRLLVFARKPAPIQVTAWGHATGTGLATMDYFFADPVAVPAEERELYAEQVLDLPCVVSFEPPDYLPEVSPLPSCHGKPLTYGCVNRLEKVTDRMIALWGRILQESPGARLLVKDKGLDNPWLRDPFLRRLEQIGRIESERTLLLGPTPHAEHLKIFHQIDVALDTFPQNGGATTGETLWMGVPVVTLGGATVSSRISSSMLSVLGMQDWVAKNPDEYVNIAVQAWRDPERLATLRRELRGRVSASDIGGGQNYTRAVEKTYRLIWRKWRETQTVRGTR